MLWQHDNNLFPHNPPLDIIHIMHLIKNNPFDVSDDVCTLVQHRSQDFCGHDEAGGVWTNGDISRQQPNIKFIAKIPKFLIRDGFNGGRVDGTGAVLRCQRKGVLCSHSFTS